MTNSPWSHHAKAGVADDIDFEIKGQELQFEGLDPVAPLLTPAGRMLAAAGGRGGNRGEGGVLGGLGDFIGGND